MKLSKMKIVTYAQILTVYGKTNFGKNEGSNNKRLTKFNNPQKIEYDAAINLEKNAYDPVHDIT